MICGGDVTYSYETVDNLFKYSGEYWDEDAQLQYLRARWYDPSIGRFINKDTYEGELGNPLSLNLYTYVANNPLKYIDPSGQIPSSLEAAYMAQAIDNVTDKDIGGAALDGGWTLKEIYRGDEGLTIGVYSRIAWGVREYVLVNKGTSTNGDWGNNFQQPFGFSTDMQQSIAFAVDFVATHSGIEVTMVGHSKGGAEATANAIATNTNAITFNSAKANVREYSLSSELKSYSANMRHFVVTGDILTDTFGTPKVGEVIYLETQHPIVTKDGVKEWFNKGKANHSMKSVINALRKGRK